MFVLYFGKLKVDFYCDLNKIYLLTFTHFQPFNQQLKCSHVLECVGSAYEMNLAATVTVRFSALCKR